MHDEYRKNFYEKNFSAKILLGKPVDFPVVDVGILASGSYPIVKVLPLQQIFFT
jgi:hypothetical protein